MKVHGRSRLLMEAIPLPYNRKKMNKAIYVLILVLILPAVHPSVIHGKVYDKDYTLLPKAKVFIDSVPIQILVTENGTYSFEVKEGKYTLSATYMDDLYTWEKVIIRSNESVKIDMVLEPRKANLLPWIIGAGVLVILFFLRPKAKKKGGQKRLVDMREDLKGLVSYLNKNDGRASQTDITKALYLSKAKVSLMIAELEEKGMVKKIKRGRGNIIILRK